MTNVYPCSLAMPTLPFLSFSVAFNSIFKVWQFPILPSQKRIMWLNYTWSHHIEASHQFPSQRFFLLSLLSLSRSCCWCCSSHLMFRFTLCKSTYEVKNEQKKKSALREWHWTAMEFCTLACGGCFTVQL